MRVETIGKATLYLGDCLEVLPMLDGLRDGCQNGDVSVEQGRGAGNDLKTRIHVVITDPPYGVGLEYGDAVDDSLAASTTRLITFVDAAVKAADIVLTTVGCYAIEKALYVQRPPQWRLCWRKGITSRPSPVGFTDWEPVFVYGAGSVHRHAHDLFTAAPEKMGTWGHPCPKSEDWAKQLIQRFTKAGDTVCDPFMGSGTTGAAAVRGNRNFIGIEIEPKYFDISCERIADAQRQERLFA